MTASRRTANGFAVASEIGSANMIRPIAAPLGGLPAGLGRTL